MPNYECERWDEQDIDHSYDLGELLHGWVKTSTWDVSATGSWKEGLREGQRAGQSTRGKRVIAHQWQALLPTTVTNLCICSLDPPTHCLRDTFTSPTRQHHQTGRVHSPGMYVFSGDTVQPSITWPVESNPQNEASVVKQRSVTHTIKGDTGVCTAARPSGTVGREDTILVISPKEQELKNQMCHGHSEQRRSH